MINAPAVFGLLLTLSYVLGAIPFSQIICRFKGVDLSTVGSGNYGATNVYRALGFSYAITVFILDIIKGAIPTYIALSLFPSSVIHLIVGFTAIFGHMYSLFLGFRGGKGVATTIGVFLVLTPMPMVITICVAALILYLFRYASLASITGACVLPILCYAFDASTVVVGFISTMSFFVVVKHRSNIRRLLTGTEHKI